ncbi:MAG TPA: hypothetical protein VF630_19350 [Hymenobacter sp.]|jgi:hypothetical protein
MLANNTFLRELRTELSQVAGDPICQAWAVHHLGAALEAARPFGPVRAAARPRPTAEAATLTLEFADGTRLQVSSRCPQPGAPCLMLSLSRNGRPEYARAVEHRQLRDSIALALQAVA